MTVKTRFAPSPTGYLHIGGVRTALYSWAFAKHHGGEFLLRIEDTDLERSTQESVDIILQGMDWVGLHADNRSNIVYQSKNCWMQAMPTTAIAAKKNWKKCAKKPSAKARPHTTAAGGRKPAKRCPQSPTA